MALKTRKTPTARNRTGTGTTARGQGKTSVTGRGRKTIGAGANNNTIGNKTITAQNISTYQQWLRFGQKNNLLARLYGSPTHVQEFQKFMQSQPANLSAGGRRNQAQAMTA